MKRSSHQMETRGGMSSGLVPLFLIAVYLLTVFAVGTLHAAESDAVSVGGQYRVMANFSNFNFHQSEIGASEPTRHFFNVRFRT